MPLAIKPTERSVPWETEVATLAGPLCTPGDILGRNVRLNTLKVGDTITVPNVGAYGVTASLLLFLNRPAPCEVVVRGDEILSVSQLQAHRVTAGEPGYR